MSDFIQIAERFANNQQDTELSLSDKILLSEANPEKIFKEMKEILYTEDQNMVRKTSLEVLKKYWRYFETSDQGTQTYDNLIEELKNDIVSKAEIIKGLKKFISDLEKKITEGEIKESLLKTALKN